MEEVTFENSGKDVVIRDFKEDDAQKLAVLYKSVFDVHNVFSKDEQEVVAYIIDNNEVACGYGGGFLVCEVDGSIVGGVFVRRINDDDSEWRLSHVGLSEKYRGDGVGAKLLEIAESNIVDALKERDVSTSVISVHVYEGEKDTCGFYEKCGFTLEKEFEDDEHREKVYRFVKKVSLENVEIE